MRTLVKDRILVVIPDDDRDRALLATFAERGNDRVYALRGNGDGLSFHDLGERDAVCRTPIAISSRARDEAHRLIANFAATPFVLDGTAYASVEGFWQSLKFPKGPERDAVAQMTGSRAKNAAKGIGAPTSFDYLGTPIRYGRSDHWLLMERACLAKFSQHDAARAALLSTGERPLTHPVRRDSDSIPSAIMCQIWMRVRATLR